MTGWALLWAVPIALALWVWHLKRRLSWSRPSPRRHDLRLAVRAVGSGETTTVLLHGLAGSGRYFGAEYEALPGRVIIPDLLGFGASRQRESEAYDVDAHVSAITETLDALNVGQMTIVGHSTGTVLALALARARPTQVNRIVAIAPVLYRDSAQARMRLESMGMMVRVFSMPGPLPERLCRWMCAHRRTAAWLFVLLRPDLPRIVAQDGVHHTWRSYVQTLQSVILDSQSATWLATLPVPIDLVAGRDDSAMALDMLQAEARDGVTLTVVDGGHDLPLSQTAACLAAIRAS